LEFCPAYAFLVRRERVGLADVDTRDAGPASLILLTEQALFLRRRRTATGVRAPRHRGKLAIVRLLRLMSDILTISHGGTPTLVIRADSLTKYAELVALRIHQHDERISVALADVDMPRAETFDYYAILLIPLPPLPGGMLASAAGTVWRIGARRPLALQQSAPLVVAHLVAGPRGHLTGVSRVRLALRRFAAYVAPCRAHGVRRSSLP
jgi:hypothetical protein